MLAARLTAVLAALMVLGPALSYADAAPATPPGAKKPSPFPSPLTAGNNPQELVEDLDGAHINWTTGRLTANGVGTPGDRGTLAFRRTLAARAARADAYRRLASALELIRVDANSRVKDLAIADDALRTRLNDLVKASRLVDTNYWPDGSAELILGVEMRGDRSLQALITSGGKAQPTPAPKPSGTGAPTATPTPAAAASGREVVTEPVNVRMSHSALIIDAKGLGAQPALVPGVRDGNRGAADKPIDLPAGNPVRYFRDGAELDPEAGLNPLKVKATRTYGTLRADFVLTPGSVEALKAALKDKRMATGFPILIQL